MGDLETKYVTPDGQLTDDTSKADREWLPALCTEVLDGRKVRFIPHTAYNIDEARGVIIGCMKPLGELKQTAGIGDAIKQLSDSDLQTLVGWTVPGKEDLIDGATLRADREKAWAQMSQGSKDDQLVLLLTVYLEATPQYPKGCYAVFGGNEFRLIGEPWVDPETQEGLSVPLAQFKQLDEGDEDDPYGYGYSDILGPMNEMRGGQVANWQTFLDRFNRLKWLIPTTSNIQAPSSRTRWRVSLPTIRGAVSPRFRRCRTIRPPRRSSCSSSRPKWTTRADCRRPRRG